MTQWYIKRYTLQEYTIIVHFQEKEFHMKIIAVNHELKEKKVFLFIMTL